MKILWTLIAVLLVTAPAFATPVTPQQGQQYYQNCVKKQDGTMTPQTQDIFCQCTAKYMVKNLTWEDVQMVAAQDRGAINKMMIGVYAPCLEFPVRERVSQECGKQGAPANMCSCLSTNIGKYTASESQRLLGDVLAKYPNALDPIAAIKQSPEFDAQQENIARQCANGTLK